MLVKTHRHQGFTLIEIMVVVTIIGILSGLIVMNIVTHDPQKDLNREAQRLVAVLDMAKDEALFGREDIGVVVTESGYNFAHYGIPESDEESDNSELTSTDPALSNPSTSTSTVASTSLVAPTTKPEPKWIAMNNEGEFRAYELPEDYEIELEVDDQKIDPTGGKKEDDRQTKLTKTDLEVEKEEEIQPSIYISPSSEMTPFVMEIYMKDNSDIRVKISGDETGRIWIGDDEDL